jgi:hypothetical protein
MLLVGILGYFRRFCRTCYVGESIRGRLRRLARHIRAPSFATCRVFVGTS